MSRKTRFLYFSLTLCMLAAAAYGKVFLRWGTAGNPRKFVKSVGGTIAYNSDITLNGGEGEVSVYSVLGGMSSVAQKFKRSVKFDEWAWNGGNMAMGSLESGGMNCRVLITSMPASTQTLVFLFEQTAKDAELSSKPPAKHMMKEVPPYPSSEPTFFIEDKNTSMELAVASTNADKTDVHSYYDMSLRSTGWTAALSSSKKPTPKSQSLRVFVKGSSLCCLFVDDSDKTGVNRITLLHKEAAIK